MNSLDSFSITTSSAASTYNKLKGGAAEIKKGSKKTRLDLTSSVSEKRAAAIYVEVIGTGIVGSLKASILSLMDRKFIKLSHNGQTIYVNVNSLSKRIGLSLDEIYEHVKNEQNLQQVIEKCRQTYVGKEQEVTDRFNKIKNYYKNKEAAESPVLKIGENQLRKILGIDTFLRESNSDTIYKLKDKTSVLLHQTETGKTVVTLFTNEVIGKGLAGEVKLVHEIGQKHIRTKVAKLAFNDSKFKQSTENEYKILQPLKGNIGIQEAPYKLVDVRDPHCYGYLASKYDGNLSATLQNLSPQQRQVCARQLLQGLVILEEQGIAHGDIKLENCLVRKTKKDEYKCVIADFGWAVKVSDQGEVKWSDACTPLYMCERDKVEFFLKNDNVKRELAFKRDVYAMGIVINLLISTEEIDSKIKKKINKLYEQMTDENWQNRITASKALTKFNKIFPVQE